MNRLTRTLPVQQGGCYGFKRNTGSLTERVVTRSESLSEECRICPGERFGEANPSLVDSF